MTVWLGPDSDPQAWALVVTADEPWHAAAVTVHRGMGGGVQVVWSAAAADAGQRVTHRCPAVDVPALLDQLAAPGRVTLSTDDPSCAVLPGPGVITRTDIRYQYGVTPAAADIVIELTAVT